MKISILYSGGLDSLVMKQYAAIQYPAAEVKCVYYKHGAESEEKEISCLPEFVKVRQLDWLNQDIQPLAKESDPFATNIYIPGRNLVFACLAASQDLPDEVWMGTLFDEDNPQATDKNEHFRSETSKLLSYVLSPFKKGVIIRFPLAEMQFTKRTEVAWALKNGLTKEDLINTNSCWHNTDGIPCGKCKQCLKRMLAFEVNGIFEDYRVHPMNDPGQLERVEDYLNLYNTGKCNADEKAFVELFHEWQKVVR